jgi:hypothetical protein
MKEIDLLPQWYKAGQRRKVGLQSQCIGLGILLVVLLICNFLAGDSVSKAEARVMTAQPRQDRAETALQQATKLDSQLARLKAKAGVLSGIDSHIDIAKVLSELSFLIASEVVISDISCKAEPISAQTNALRMTGIRMASSRSSGKAMVSGPVQFKVVIKGIAAETSDVGEMVLKLEQSEYFSCVNLSLSRNKKVKVLTEDGTEDRNVSEFEISCRLANYQIGRTAVQNP